MKKSLDSLRTKSKLMKDELYGNSGNGPNPPCNSDNDSHASVLKKSALKELHSEFKGKILTSSSSKLNKEEETLKMMNKFKKTLTSSSIEQKDPKQKRSSDASTKLCMLHYVHNCESCGSTRESSDSSDEDWMKQPLMFKSDISANVYEPKVTDYTILDPREADKDNFMSREIEKTKKYGYNTSHHKKAYAPRNKDSHSKPLAERDYRRFHAYKHKRSESPENSGHRNASASYSQRPGR